LIRIEKGLGRSGSPAASQNLASPGRLVTIIDAPVARSGEADLEKTGGISAARSPMDG
jgi:hypothetical protein